MKRLTAKTLHGIWAGVTMSWEANDRFDAKSYAANIERMCKAGVHGIYTTGSTGEFYAIDDDEFKLMVDIQADICGRCGMPLQIGCNADSTRKILRMVEYACTKKAVGAVQVVVPYWMELTEREMLQYFKDLYTACPQMPLVHYNIPRAKRFMTGDDYLKVLQAAPTLIGVKFTFVGSHFADLQSALLKTPNLSYFVAEPYLASAMQLGAKGSCSSLIGTDPKFMLAMYDHCARKRWEKALEMQKIVQRFYEDATGFIGSRGEGLMDPVFDKGLAVASGSTAGSQRIRAPYIGWSDETVRAMRQWLRKNYPMFLHPSLKRGNKA